MDAPLTVIFPRQWTGGRENVTGYFIDVLQHLESKLNFNAALVPSVDGYWGSRDEASNWNGMVGMLINEEADMCGAALSFTGSRAEVRHMTRRQK